MADLFDLAKGAVGTISNNASTALALGEVASDYLPIGPGAKKQAPKTRQETRKGIFSNMLPRAPGIEGAFTFTAASRSTSFKYLNFIEQHLYLFKLVSKAELYGIQEKGLDASSPEKALLGQYPSAPNGMLILVVRLPAGFKKQEITVKDTNQVWIKGVISSNYIYVVDNADKEKKSVKVKIDGQEVNLIPIAAYIGKTFFERKDFKREKAAANTKLALIQTLEDCKAAIVAYKANLGDGKKKEELRELFNKSVNLIVRYRDAVKNIATAEATKAAEAQRAADLAKKCALKTFFEENGTQEKGGVTASDAAPAGTPTPSKLATAPAPAPAATPAPAPTPAPTTSKPSAAFVAPEPVASPPAAPIDVSTPDSEPIPASVINSQDVPSQITGEKPAFSTLSVATPSPQKTFRQIARKVKNASNVNSRNQPSILSTQKEQPSFGGGKPRRKKANAASDATAPRPRQLRKPRRPS